MSAFTPNDRLDALEGGPAFNSDELTGARSAFVSDAPQLVGSPGQGDLLGPFERWPTRRQLAAFGTHRDIARSLLARQPWPEALASLISELPIGAPFAQCADDLRGASALIAMLVHLREDTDPTGAVDLVNDRRRRTRYGSYPTPPQVARAIARHVAAHLPPTGEPLTILDPTIEGAPLLLECALALRPRPDVRLVGIDRMPAAITAVSALFDHGSGMGLPRPDLVVDDAFAAMTRFEAVDAIVNNPPWGERRRNGVEHFPGVADPYAHFAMAGLSRLKPGGPFGFVLPGQAFTAATARDLRQYLRSEAELDLVAVLPKHCFPRATMRTVVLLGRKRRAETSRRKLTLISHPAGELDRPAQRPGVRMLDLAALDANGAPWLACALVPASPLTLSASVPLAEVASVDAGIVPYRLGRGRPVQTREILDARPFTYAAASAGAVPVLRGRQVRTLHCRPPCEWIALGPHLASAGDHEATRFRPRVFVRELCGRDGRLVAAPAPEGCVPRYGVICITPRRPVRLLTLAAILNSAHAARHVSAHCDGVFRESFNRVRVGDVRRFPLPRCLIEDDAWSRRVEALCEALLVADTASDKDRLAQAIEELVDRAYGKGDGA